MPGHEEAKAEKVADEFSEHLRVSSPVAAETLRQGKMDEEELRAVLIEPALRLGGEPGAKLDMVLLNAGAALMAGGKAATIPEGIALARELIASGAALRKLDELVRFSRS